MTSINVIGLQAFTQLLQYRFLPHMERLVKELKRRNDLQETQMPTKEARVVYAQAVDIPGAIQAIESGLGSGLSHHLQRALHLLGQGSPLHHSEPHEVFEAHEVRVGRDMFEQLVCPKEECSHHFLVKMEDLDAGAAAWVWCPLCKTKTPLHMEKEDETE